MGQRIVARCAKPTPRSTTPNATCSQLSAGFDAALALRENGTLRLLGVPPEKPAIPLDADDVMRHLVLRNACVVGSVNSNARHVAIALLRLQRFRERWPALLGSVITHHYSPEEAVEACRADDEGLIKKVIDWRG